MARISFIIPCLVLLVWGALSVMPRRRPQSLHTRGLGRRNGLTDSGPGESPVANASALNSTDFGPGPESAPIEEMRDPLPAFESTPMPPRQTFQSFQQSQWQLTQEITSATFVQPGRSVNWDLLVELCVVSE